MKKLPLRRHKRNFSYLLTSILCFILLSFIFHKYPPTGSIDVSLIEIPVLPIFLILICGFIFSAVTFVLIRKLQGAIFTVFVMLYIFIRVAGFTHIIFLIILTVGLIALELIMYKKK